MSTVLGGFAMIWSAFADVLNRIALAIGWIVLALTAVTVAFLLAEGWLAGRRQRRAQAAERVGAAYARRAAREEVAGDAIGEISRDIDGEYRALCEREGDGRG